MCGSLHKFEQQLQKENAQQAVELAKLKAAFIDMKINLRFMEKTYEYSSLQLELLQQLGQGPVFIPESRHFPALDKAAADGDITRTYENVELPVKFQVEWIDDVLTIVKVDLGNDWKARLETAMAELCPPNTTLVCQDDDLDYEDWDLDDCPDLESPDSDGWHTYSFDLTFILLERTK